MEYYINKLSHVLNSKVDIGENIYSDNGLTVSCFNVHKSTAIMETNDLPAYQQGERRTICYIVLSGELEFWLGDENVHVKQGSSITIMPDMNFSIWAVENSVFLAAHNNVEPDVDNTPSELVEAVNKVELKDTYLQGHNYRVGKYSTLMMQIINEKKATTPFHFAAAYHDVGKVVVDANVLNKNGKLTDEEFEMIKKHPVASYEMLKENVGETVAKYARWHHEKLDGSGYPDGLKGDQIPLESRVICVADIFDALTTARCYRKAFSFEKALSIMEEDVIRGKIDKQCYDVLKKLVDEGQIVDGEDNNVSIYRK